MYEGTTYVPLRAVAEALNKGVGYDSVTQTATISSKRSIASDSELVKIAKTADTYMRLCEIANVLKTMQCEFSLLIHDTSMKKDEQWLWRIYKMSS